MSVINLDRHRFRINHQPDKNLAATVAEKAVQAGWGLYELIPESNTLEDTFVQLTSGDIGNEQVDNKDI